MRIEYTNYQPADIDKILAVEHGIGFPDTADVFLVAHIDDTPIGYLVANVHSVMTCVHSIFVLPRFRKRGVATALLNECMKFINDAQVLQLDCFAGNKEAYALYTKFGFEPYFITMQCRKKQDDTSYGSPV